MEYTAKELERLIMQNGWYLVGQKGSHRHYKHAILPGKISIPFHKPDNVKIGTALNIIRAARIKEVSK